MDGQKLISCAAFARRNNVSRKTATLWLRRGLIVRDENGSGDIEASDRKLAGRPAVISGGVTRGPNSSKSNAVEVTGNGRAKAARCQ